jgi:hypothetical protein
MAGVGVWLISRPEEGIGRPEWLGIAVLAGCGFAVFYLCVNQAGNASAIWIACCSRWASFTVTSIFVLATRQVRAMSVPILALAIFTGFLDIIGSALFVRASQRAV